MLRPYSHDVVVLQALCRDKILLTVLANIYMTGWWWWNYSAQLCLVLFFSFWSSDITHSNLALRVCSSLLSVWLFSIRFMIHLFGTVTSSSCIVWSYGCCKSSSLTSVQWLLRECLCAFVILLTVIEWILSSFVGFQGIDFSMQYL